MGRKPEINIIGNLCFEPCVGYRAFIECDDGNTLYTSQIVDVRNKTKNGVEIETKNTIYKVTFSAESLPLAS